jgi:hypothetical protein
MSDYELSAGAVLSFSELPAGSVVRCVSGRVELTQPAGHVLGGREGWRVERTGRVSLRALRHAHIEILDAA